MHAKTFQRVLYIYLCVVSFCDAKQDRFCGASEFVQYTFKSPPVRPPARPGNSSFFSDVHRYGSRIFFNQVNELEQLQRREEEEEEEEW